MINTLNQNSDAEVPSEKYIDILPYAIAAFDSYGNIIKKNHSFDALFSTLPELTQPGLNCNSFDELLRQMTAPDSDVPIIDYVDTIASASANHTLKHNIIIQTQFNDLLVLERTLVFNSAAGDSAGVMCFRDVTNEYQIDKRKTEFLCTTAHELRAPMANIFGYSELLINNVYETEKQREMLQIIHEETSRLLKILNDHLDLARIESLAKQTIQLHEESTQQLIGEVIREQQHILAKHHITLQTTGEIEDLVLCDKAKMKQVLINVLSNAAKFSDVDSMINIQITSKQNQGLDGILIKITDHGMGMTPSQLDSVFERFYRVHVDDRMNGSGLGMTIVKEIIELHNGEIYLTSKLHEGTTVHIWIPSARPTIMADF